jgi:hypothetical protein
VIITVLIFGDYYVAFWGLLLFSISGIIQATRLEILKGHYKAGVASIFD